MPFDLNAFKTLLISNCSFFFSTAIGRLCEKCEYNLCSSVPLWSWTISFYFSGDGKCVICDSYVRPCTLVRICDECNYGSYQGRCVICGGPGVSDAYYCKECTITEKDVSFITTVWTSLKHLAAIDHNLELWAFCLTHDSVFECIAW